MWAQRPAVITYIQNHSSDTLSMDKITALHKAECNTSSNLKVSIAIQQKYNNII